MILDNLRLLLAAVDQYPDEHFSMRSYLSPRDFNSPGCLASHARELLPRVDQWRTSPLKALENLLDVSKTDARRLAGQDMMGGDNHSELWQFSQDWMGTGLPVKDLHGRKGKDIVLSTLRKLYLS